MTFRFIPAARPRARTRNVRRRWGALLIVGAVLVAAIGCSGAKAHPTAASAPSTPGAQDNSTDALVPSTDGVRLKVHAVGPASARRLLLLVHGGPGLSYASLSPLLKLPGPTWRVVAYDQRGAGGSSAPRNGDYGFAAYLTDLDAVRRWTGAGQVVVLGHSWGGAVAAGYAATHPTQVTGLILTGAVPLNWAAFQTGQNLWRQRETSLVQQGLVPAQDALPAVVNGSCEAQQEALVPVYLADPHRHVDRGDLIGHSCTAIVATPSFSGLEHAPLTELAAALGGWHGRALILEGDRDPFGLGWLHTEVQQLRSAAVTSLVVPGAGHFPWVEQPGTVAHAIRTFLG